MGVARMANLANFAIIAIVLLAVGITRSQMISRGNDSWNWKSMERRVRSADSTEDVIRDVFRKISNGTSNVRDDDDLVNLIQEEIVRTAQSIKTPAGSIEAAARRAQRLVSELTAAYTTAIYKSKSTEDARENFARFQNTVQRIVDFIKDGQFVN